MNAYRRRDYPNALHEWQPLAEQGNARAQFHLGSMYRRGSGVPQDYKTAVKWYTLAAEQGYSIAQFSLGNLYGYGTGVTQDNVTALKWWRLAAEQGHVPAQSNFKYLEKKIAQQQSSPTVTAEKTPIPLSGDYQKGWDAYRIGDYATALRELKPLAERGNIHAQVRLGIMYDYGKGGWIHISSAILRFSMKASAGV